MRGSRLGLRSVGRGRLRCHGGGGRGGVTCSSQVPYEGQGGDGGGHQPEFGRGEPEPLLRQSAESAAEGDPDVERGGVEAEQSRCGGGAEGDESVLLRNDDDADGHAPDHRPDQGGREGMGRQRGQRQGESGESEGAGEDAGGVVAVDQAAGGDVAGQSAESPGQQGQGQQRLVAAGGVPQSRADVGVEGVGAEEGE